MLTTHASRLETAQANYQSAPKGKAASAVVKDLDEADQKRDNAYQTLVNFVKAYAHVDGQVVEAAYTKLSDLIKSYKNVTKVTYEEESAQLARFLEQLAKPDYQEALTTLNITSHYDNLQAVRKANSLWFIKPASASKPIPRLAKASNKNKPCKPLTTTSLT